MKKLLENITVKIHMYIADVHIVFCFILNHIPQ